MYIKASFAFRDQTLETFVCSTCVNESMSHSRVSQRPNGKSPKRKGKKQPKVLSPLEEKKEIRLYVEEGKKRRRKRRKSGKPRRIRKFQCKTSIPQHMGSQSARPHCRSWEGYRRLFGRGTLTASFERHQRRCREGTASRLLRLLAA